MKNVTEIVNLTSDLSGKEATAERTLRVGDLSVHLDLTDPEAASFDKAVAKYLEKGTAVKSRSTKSDGKAAQIREWANANGFEVGARGRIADEVREAFEKAQSTPEPVDA